MEINELTEAIIGAAIEVHRQKGPGLLESSYEACLQHELQLQGLKSLRHVSLPITYKDLTVKEAYKIDLLVEDTIIIELKVVETIKELHKAQLLTYLREAKKPLGLLINFNTTLLKDGLRRIINNQ